MKFDQFLDATGESCPMPLLKAKRRLNAMQPGECLKVQASDPGSLRDFRAFAELAGHRLIESHPSDVLFVYYLIKN